MNKFAFAALAFVAFATPAMAQTAVRGSVTVTGGARFTAQQQATLDQMAQQVLGPVPGNARGYTSTVTANRAAPAPGCVWVQAMQGGHGTFDRWRCPRGTVSGLVR